MKHWICTQTSTNDQGLVVGVIADNEKEPYIEWENTEWKEISNEDKKICETDNVYRDILCGIPLYVVVDLLGGLLYTGSYGSCEWYKDGGDGIKQLMPKIISRTEYISSITEKINKSTWWNTLNRMIEIEGGKLDNNSIKLVDDLIKHYLLPNEYSFSQDRIALSKWFKTNFMTFDDSNSENIVMYDLGEFLRIRLTFGDRPINRDAIIDINFKLLKI